ncbi:MAG: hypothetical protein ABIH11_00755 [Candidatus Altiarchaeota archaeon]
MKTGTIKVILYALLLALTALLTQPYGIAFNWALHAIILTILVILILYVDFEERNYDSRMISLLSVLVAVTVLSRQIIHGVEFSPVFFLTILVGHVFGFAPGFAAGSMTMMLSNFFIGHGPWTPFQMLGLGLCGGFAAFIPKAGGRLRIASLVAYSILAAYSYGMFLDLFSWLLFIPTHTIESYVTMVLAGMVANTSRAVGNAFFMSVFSIHVLRVFERFRRRFTLAYVD